MFLTWLVSLQATLGPVCPKVDRFPLTQARSQSFKDKEGKKTSVRSLATKSLPDDGQLVRPQVLLKYLGFLKVSIQSLPSLTFLGDYLLQRWREE